MKWKRRLIQWVCLVAMVLITSPLYASVLLKVSASNPSSFAERTVPLKSYLPKGIRPENVVNSDGLDIGYDVKRGQCYVYKDLLLKPKVEVTYDVEIDDIWLIKEELLQELLRQTDVLIKKLEKTSFAAASLELDVEIKNKVKGVRDRQEESAVVDVGPTEHIIAYETNLEMIKRIEEHIKDLERLLLAAKEDARAGKKTESSGVKAAIDKIKKQETQKESFKIGDIAGELECLIEATLEGEEGYVFDSPKRVSLQVIIENPSTTEEATIPLKYSLAKEIRGNDVVDAGGLNVGFDFEEELFYVFDDAVRLAPDEKRMFEVVLNNKWAIDKRSIFSTRVYVQSMVYFAKKVSKLSEIKKIGEDAIEKLNELLQREEATELNERYVVSFREDQKKKEEVEVIIQKMMDLFIQNGFSPDEVVAEQERLCERAEELGISKQEIKKGLTSSKVLPAEDVKLLAGTIFKGKSTSTKAIWSAIWAIIVFLGVISGIFYYVNIRQQKGAMFDPLTGAFTKTYISDRLKEELKIAKGSKGKCSLLVMDIDKFKKINDTYGHATGDSILKEFVIALRKGVRATDLVGRFGGDEFWVVLSTSEKGKALNIAVNIARIISETIIKIDQQSFQVTASIGVATFPDDSGTAEDLFNKADRALYQVKRSGGNGARAFEG